MMCCPTITLGKKEKIDEKRTEEKAVTHSFLFRANDIVVDQANGFAYITDTKPTGGIVVRQTK